MAEFIFRGTTRLSWLENVGDLLGSPEEGVKLKLALTLKTSEGRKTPPRPAAQVILPFGNPAGSGPFREPDPRGFAAHARAWCALVG
jgi:hypothetical protein